jgi:K+-sensing histidine kinase KdpD
MRSSSPPAGEVRLAACPTETGVAVDVCDTGIGIDSVTLEHIFDEYYQGEGGWGRPFVGTGMGLAIASRLAHDMDGRITVESDLGHGSCFTLHPHVSQRARGPRTDNGLCASSVAAPTLGCCGISAADQSAG